MFVARSFCVPDCCYRTIFPNVCTGWCCGPSTSVRRNVHSTSVLVVVVVVVVLVVVVAASILHTNCMSSCSSSSHMSEICNIHYVSIWDRNLVLHLCKTLQLVVVVE